MQQPWLTRHSTVMMKHRVMSLTTSRVRMRTQLVASLHQRNAAEGETRMTEICTTSSATMMHVAKSKTGIRSVSTLNRSDRKKGTMINMVSTLTNLTDSILPKRSDRKKGRNARGVKAFSCDLKTVCWPLNFKPSEIEKYDRSTNPTEWLEVYQLTIEAAGGDSNVMLTTCRPAYHHLLGPSS
jgi:hypothetical protein